MLRHFPQFLAAGPARFLALALLGALPLCLVSPLPVSAQVIQSDGYFSPTLPLSFNKGALNIGYGLQLTQGKLQQAASVFTKHMVNIWAFHTTFNFQFSKGVEGDPNILSDGITFCLQTSAPTLVAGSGSDLGYSDYIDTQGAVDSLQKTFPNSVAVKFDPIHLPQETLDSNSETGLYTDGASTYDGLDMLSDGVDLTDLNVFQVSLSYTESSKRLLETVTDTQTGATYTHEYDIDIAETLGGDKAYVGFTAATGGNAAYQTIGAWTYNSDYYENGFAIGEPGTALVGAANPGAAAGSRLNTGNLLPALCSVLNGYAKFESATPDTLLSLLNSSNAGNDVKLLGEHQLAPYYVGTDLLAGQDVGSYLQSHCVGAHQHVLLRLSTKTGSVSAPDYYVVVLSRRADGDWNVFDPAWTRDVVYPTSAIDTLSGHEKGFSIRGKAYTFFPTTAFLFAPGS